MILEFVISKGTESDLQDVINIDYGSYYPLLNEKTPKRELIAIRSFYNKCREGFFVAKQGDRNVGFIFSRVWGSLGWSGPSSVIPEYQKHGIGKELLAYSVDYLKKNNCRYYGFETIHNNICPYFNNGAMVGHTTLLMKKGLEENVEIKKEISVRKCDSIGSQKIIEGISMDVLSGLDLGNEMITNEIVLGYKTILIFVNNMPIGFFSASENKNFVYIPLFALKSEFKEQSIVIIQVIEDYYYKKGYKSIKLPVNCIDDKLLAKLKKTGYKGVGYSFRMFGDDSEIMKIKGTLLCVFGT